MLNIHDIVNRIDRGDMSIYSDITSNISDKKHLDTNISWMIPQWFTGAINSVDMSNSVIMFDLACNSCWKSLYKHPELQTKLMAAIGNGSTKHKFYRPTAKRPFKYNELFQLLQLFYEDVKEDEVPLYWMGTDITDLEELMDRAGILPENRSGICKQYKKLIKILSSG